VSFSLWKVRRAAASSGVIQVLTGLDSTPRVAFEVDFRDPSGVKKMAVSDDGQLLTVLTAAARSICSPTRYHPLLACAASPPRGSLFCPTDLRLSSRMPATDAELASVVNGAPAVQPVAAGVSSSGGETLVEASRDGASAFVVATGSTSACRVDLTTAGCSR